MNIRKLVRAKKAAAKIEANIILQITDYLNAIIPGWEYSHYNDHWMMDYGSEIFAYANLVNDRLFYGIGDGKERLNKKQFIHALKKHRKLKNFK